MYVGVRYIGKIMLTLCKKCNVYLYSKAMKRAHYIANQKMLKLNILKKIMSTDVTSKFASTDHTCIIQTKNKFSEHMICF